MNSPRAPRLALSVVSVALVAGSSVAQQQPQAAWGPSQQSMYHNHPGTSPTYTAYGKPTNTFTLPAQSGAVASSKESVKPSSMAPASSKRVSGRPAKARRAE